MTPLVFFGSSEYSLIVLERLLTLSQFKVVLVVTKTDKPFGRDKIITPNPVAKFAAEHQLNLIQIEVFDENCKLKIKNYQAELGLCVAFGPPFFDQEMIDTFPKGIVNIHPSPLPKYRGATPGVWQITNGETTSAVTFFKIDQLPDHGPIIAQIPFEISSSDTSDTFYRRAFTVASNHLDSLLLTESHPQDESQKSYYPKLVRNMAQIDWSWSPEKIERFVRAMNPWPIAWTNVFDKNNKNTKIKVISAKIIDGKIEFEKVVLDGKKATFWSEIKSHYFINTSPIN